MVVLVFYRANELVGQTRMPALYEIEAKLPHLEALDSVLTLVGHGQLNNFDAPKPEICIKDDAPQSQVCIQDDGRATSYAARLVRQVSQSG